MYMIILRYLSMFLLLTGIGVLYDKYKKKYDLDGSVRKNQLIGKYLLSNKTGFSEKPILWIHNKRTINQRNWDTFGSRNTNSINQPYVMLCLKSIIKHCSDSFNVCMIDDDSFEKLLPDWKIKLNKLAEPMKSNCRALGMVKLLYNYGGMCIPESTLIFKDLYSLYDNSMKKSDMFTVEGINKSSSAFDFPFLTNNEFLGCKKESQNMKLFMHYLERLISKNSSDSVKFLGLINRWLYNRRQEIVVVNGLHFGIKTKKGKRVLISDLLSKNYINYDNRILYGLYIPEKDILNRTKYQWFAKLSEKEILESDMIISKYIILGQHVEPISKAVSQQKLSTTRLNISKDRWMS